MFTRLINSVTSERSVGSRSVLGWEGYTGKQLHRIVVDARENLAALTRKSRAELKERLLPALNEIRRRIKSGEAFNGYETFKEYLNSVGLTDSLFRSWEFPLREKEMRELGLLEASNPGWSGGKPNEQKVVELVDGMLFRIGTDFYKVSREP